jgi:hypothetical protein
MSMWLGTRFTRLVVMAVMRVMRMQMFVFERIVPMVVTMPFTK